MYNPVHVFIVIWWMRNVGKVLFDLDYPPFTELTYNAIRLYEGDDEDNK